MVAQPAGLVKWLVRGTLLLAAFVYSLNAKGTILESEIITQRFGLDHYRMQWITGPEGVVGLTAFFTASYLIKLWGARRVFMVGASLMTAGCAVVCVAQTPVQYGVGGVVRNCAGLYMIPTLVMMQRITPGHQRIGYCVFLSMVYAGQVVAEPLGALVAYHPSWRALFAAILVSGVLLIVAAAFLFPDDRPETGPTHPFDFGGAALFAAGLSLMFFLLYRGNYLGWWVSTAIWLAAVCLALVIVLFVWWEVRAPDPFMPFGAFAYKTITLTMVASVFWCASLYGIALHLPNCLLALGYEHWKTGWVTLPMSLVMLAAMWTATFVWQRHHYVWLLRAGLAGMTVLGFALARVDLYTYWQWVLTLSVAWGACAGVCLPPIAQLTYEGQTPEAVGATGVMKFLVRALASTVGVLAAAVVLDRGTAWGLEYVRASMVRGQGELQIVEPSVRAHMAYLGSAPETAAAQTDALLGTWVQMHAQVIGYRAALQFCASLSAMGLLISFAISRRKEISVYDADI